MWWKVALLVFKLSRTRLGRKLLMALVKHPTRKLRSLALRLARI
jgi:hypothetical protein